MSDPEAPPDNPGQPPEPSTETAMGGFGFAAFLLTMTMLFDQVDRGAITSEEAHAVIARASDAAQRMRIPGGNPEAARFAAGALRQVEQMLHAMTAKENGKPQ